MANPKVKKGKSGSKNDSTKVKKRRKMEGGDAGFISDKILNRKKKK